MHCASCLKDIEKGEPITKVRHKYRYGWKSGDYCQECSQDETKIAFDWWRQILANDKGAERIYHKQHCEQCGREVGFARPRKRRPVVLCSPSCSSGYSQRGKRKVRHQPKPCAHCGEEFTPKRTDARYCSDKCRVYSNREKGDGVPATPWQCRYSPDATPHL